ncbi:TetR family transcriptional regulator [Buchananella hordeovulneris]|uniref:HTH tetR-type domain-containing protein n=1 Tax=Buchananella hordeovulneris TaxID=52770 RepID=A0A1Q5PUF6_9ACTO|nr:TetR family transcriptional regulator [Buchananella hordeovulneris]OKL51223.1 hypothetical protein BSZ40_08780 [Buchananella hordeovulneris]
MPKIDAATVKEHRQSMSTKLLDAAEELLLTAGPHALTAAAVAGAVGIARNSVYRYVDSMDTLRGQVVARYLPTWTAAVTAAVAQASTPRARLLAYVHANLSQAADSGHGALIQLARGLPAAALAPVAAAHAALARLLGEQCQALDPTGAKLTAQFVQAILEIGFSELDAGAPLAQIQHRCTQAVAALVDARQDTN